MSSMSSATATAIGVPTPTIGCMAPTKSPASANRSDARSSLSRVGWVRPHVVGGQVDEQERTNGPVQCQLQNGCALDFAKSVRLGNGENARRCRAHHPRKRCCAEADHTDRRRSVQHTANGWRGRAMTKRTKSGIEFTPDPWLRVIADDADAARRFFGAPPNWPVKFGGFAQHRKGRVWLVKSE